MKTRRLQILEVNSQFLSGGVINETVCPKSLLKVMFLLKLVGFNGKGKKHAKQLIKLERGHWLFYVFVEYQLGKSKMLTLDDNDRLRLKVIFVKLSGMNEL